MPPDSRAGGLDIVDRPTYHSRVRRQFALLVTGALAASALVLPTVPAEASFSGANGRIAFERDGGIWTINPDGTDPQRVVVSGDDPSWSPDGTRIVYEKSGAVFVVVVATGATTNLTSTHSGLGSRRDPHFLPTGQIVYVEMRATPTNSWHLYRMEGDGSSPTDLTPAYDEVLSQPAVNSAGSMVVSANSVGKDIYDVGPGGLGTNRTNTGFPVSEGWPDLAPDGRLLFIRCCGADSGLYVDSTRVAGGPSDPNGSAGDGSFSPDGTRIAFKSNSGTNLWVMDSGGGNRVQLTGSPTANLFNVGEVDWGPVPSAAPPPPAGPPPPAVEPAAPPAAPPTAAAPTVVTKTRVTGVPRVGRTLRCRPATFSGADEVTTRWLREGKPIKGARGLSYSPTRRDVGDKVACRATATGAGGSATSTASGVRIRR